MDSCDGKAGLSENEPQAPMPDSVPSSSSIHRFLFNPELQAQLSQRWLKTQAENERQANDKVEQAKILEQKRNIVESNDKIVSEMAFDTEVEGRHTMPVLGPIESYQCADVVATLPAQRFLVTEFCVANIDTVSAALEVGDATALNFANEDFPGGGYRYGARAQEEEICRQVPQLYAHLITYEYPIAPGTTLLSRGLAVVRHPGTYKLCRSQGGLNVLTAAMPNHDPRPGTPEWDKTVTLRIRSVLDAARQSGYPNLVLGAFGCGAFGNPPDQVAEIFKRQLSSPEFRGAFAKVVFAIIDPRGDGNLLPFEKVLADLS